MGWVRLVLAPWVSGSLALAFAAAAAAPMLLVTAADHWRHAGADRIAAGVARSEEDLGRLGITFTAGAMLTSDAVGRADRVVADRLAVEGLEPATRTLFTDRMRLTPLADSVEGGRPSDETSGDSPHRLSTPGRLVARPGAVDALDLVMEGETSDPPVYISAWLAEEAGLVVGDRITVTAGLDPNLPGAEVAPGGGPSAVVGVAGIYRTVWTTDRDPPAGYWAELPEALFPRYVHPFRAPGFALLVMDEPTMGGLGLPGWSSWVATADSSPTELDELEQLRRAAIGFERATVQDRELRSALQSLAGVDSPITTVESEAPGLADEARSLAAGLDGPLTTARAAGVAVGIGVMVAAGSTMVRSRRSEYRLRAGDGERWARLAGRTIVELILPTVLGIGVGGLLGWSVARWLGPAVEPGILDGDPLAAATVVLIGLVAGAVVAGVLGQATLDDGRLGRRDRPSLVGGIVVALAAVVWLQVGRTDGRAGRAVDPAVVAMPILVLAGGAAIVVAATAAIGALTRGSSAAGRPPRRGSGRVVTSLAWRRASGAATAPRLVMGALAVGLGLITVSALLVAELNTAAEAKVVTEIGGRTRLVLYGSVPRQPAAHPDTTLLRVQATRATPGDRVLRVVAIDPATFAAAVSWPDGSDRHSAAVVELLRTPTEGGVAAIAIDGEGLPDRGAFGTTRRTPYEVVGRAASVPMATDFGSTLLVSGQALDRWELRRRVEAEGGRIDRAIDLDRLADLLGVDDADGPAVASLLAEFGLEAEAARRVLDAGLPTTSYAAHLVSQRSPTELADYVDDSGLLVRQTISFESRLLDVDLLATTLVVEYLRVLGAVATAASAAALALHVGLQRRQRALTRLITRQMGLSGPRSAMVAVGEAMIITALAVVVAGGAAPFIAQRLGARFEPSPSRPPSLEVEIPANLLILAGLGLVAVVGVSTLAVELRDSGRRRELHHSAR